MGLLADVDEHLLPLLALLAILAALIETVPGLDFVAQVGWLGALVGSLLAYLRWRRDPEFEVWPFVILVTLGFVLAGLVFQLLSEAL